MEPLMITTPGGSVAMATTPGGSVIMATTPGGSVISLPGNTPGTHTHDVETSSKILAAHLLQAAASFNLHCTIGIYNIRLGTICLLVHQSAQCLEGPTVDICTAQW